MEKQGEKKKMDLKFLWIAIAVAILAIAGIIIWVYFYTGSSDEVSSVNLNSISKSGEESKESVYAANISYVQGEVQFMDGSDEWKIAQVDGVISENGHLKTGNDSKAILELHDGSVVRLDANSEVVLIKLRENDIEIEQVLGISYHRGEHSGEGYKVVSLDAEIVPQGTAFSVGTDKDKKVVSVDVIQSEVSAALLKDGNVSVSQKCLEGKKCDIDIENGGIKDMGEISNTILAGTWYQWNKEKDKERGAKLGVLEKEIVQEKEQAQTQTQTKETTKSQLSLSASAKEGKVSLSWTETSLGSDNFKYYKVVRSETNPNLKYPDDGYIQVISKKSSTSTTDTKIADGQKYYYRICAVDGSKVVTCGNVVQVTAIGGGLAEEDLSGVSVSLSASVDASGVLLNWTKVDKSGFKYYKVVRSETNPNLKYPDDGYIKVETNKDVTSYVDNKVNAASIGTYYYRICPVIGSEVICSNVIKVVDGKVQ